MTKALIVYCHPSQGSFTAAVRDTVLARLHAKGAEVRVIDLYARGYDPTLSLAEWEGYLDSPRNRDVVAEDVAALQWADTLIFIYPTWWYALPAVLKGWLDRTMLPDVAFLMPDGVNRTIRPGLTHIRRLGVFTTCGASWWLTTFVGAPGKRMLTRGIGLLCAPRHRKAFAAHYLMDSSTPKSRARHLERVAARTDKLLR
jgi:putative NADPH-quinone reductase